jgi:uncharacterized protein YukE
MYNTTADDLARIANDLDQIAKKYTDGSQQLDQHVTSLDNATSYLLSGGPEQWVGLSSDAFHSAYLERRTRLQQASQILSQSAQHLTQFVQAIENNLPTIRADQSLMQGQNRHMLAPDDQASILNEESQAQNAIITALAALNSQLDALAEEVRDCPEELDENLPGNVNDPYNRSDSNAGGGGNDNGETDNNGGFEEPKPVGSLKRVDDNWLKRQGIDAHDLKDGLEGGASRYDIFKDRNDNLFALRKGAPQSTAIWLGNLGDL